MIKRVTQKKWRSVEPSKTFCCDFSFRQQEKNESIFYDSPKQKLKPDNKSSIIGQTTNYSKNTSPFLTPTSNLQKKPSAYFNQYNPSMLNQTQTPKYVKKQLILNDLKDESLENVLNPFIYSSNFKSKKCNRPLKENNLLNISFSYINNPQKKINLINQQLKNPQHNQKIIKIQRIQDQIFHHKQQLKSLQVQHQRIIQNRATCRQYYQKKIQQYKNSIQYIRQKGKQRQIQLNYIKEQFKQIGVAQKFN